MKGQLGELKPGLKIFSDKMDRRFERTDNKIDSMYFFLSGF